MLTSAADAMMSLVSYYGPLPSSSAWVLILRAHVSDFGHELSSKISIKTRPEHLRSVNPLSSNPHPAMQPLSWGPGTVNQAGAYPISVLGADS